MLVPFGIFETWWGAVLAYVVQVLVGTAFGSLVYALTSRLENPEGFGLLFRLGIFPLFLFSGAFFPIENLGEVGAWLARLTPLWHGVNLSRMLILDHVDWSWAAVERHRARRADRPRRVPVDHRAAEADGALMAGS